MDPRRRADVRFGVSCCRRRPAPLHSLGRYRPLLRADSKGSSIRPTSRAGNITRMGNSGVRSLLTRSSLVIMRANAADSELRRWALRIEARRGRGRARIALARKLAVIMIAMWKKDQGFTAQTRHHEPSPPLENAEAPTPFGTIRVEARGKLLGRISWPSSRARRGCWRRRASLRGGEWQRTRAGRRRKCDCANS